MDKGRVHNNIRRLRFNNGEMTQEALAEKVGVTRQTIIAIESARYSPSLDLAFRIALAFDVPLEEVFSYDLEE
jgi:putative transcriptional regulator